ncbi:hypothetical protein BDZ45DRAFT_723822 [Acephala macrosclerotiorum]|nr:hypothetical protein BDZ45DRAFT_723822 [Acephala macrosclerotiorum]
MDDQRPGDIPSELDHLIQLNVAYRVLICPHNECRKAVQPGAFREHLRVQYQTPLRDRERVQEYINGFSWDYDFSTIQLPEDGSRPQPIIPVVDGFQCQTCPFKSSNRKSIKVHGNKEHKQQRVDDDELFKKVRLQSWFQDHRQRYWVVDESERGDGREDVGIGEEEDRISGLGLREDESVVDASIDVEDDKVEKIGEVKTRDEEIAEAVVNKVVDKSVEAVVDNEEEVFSAFDDSGDEDYKESSEDGVEDGEGGSSEVEINRSNDEEYESSGVADDDEEKGLSEVDIDQSDNSVQSSGVADDDEEEVIAIRSVEGRNSNPSRKWKARKRKLQSEFEDGGVVDIDSEDDIYRNSSPAFRERRRKVTKRQKRMPRFDDSGVVMGSSQGDDVVRSSSQDDGVVPPSSPPYFLCEAPFSVKGENARALIGARGRERHLRARPHRLLEDELKATTELLSNYDLRSVAELREYKPRSENKCQMIEYLRNGISISFDYAKEREDLELVQAVTEERV